MIENNLDNKAVFMAKYWGQKVCCLGDDKEFYEVCDLLSSSKNVMKSALFLKLTPLSMITDEHAIEVLKIFGVFSPKIHYQFITKENSYNEVFRQVYYDDSKKDGGCHGIDGITVYANFANSGIHVLQSNRDTVYYNALDFLRSKGYYVGDGTEVAYNWCVLKTDK